MPRDAAWRVILVLIVLAGLGCSEAAESRRVELWTLALRPRFDAYMNDLVARFEAEHPGVDVVWVDVPFEALSRKLVSAAAAGRAPDVVNFSDSGFARFAAMGALADLRPHLPPESLDAYVPGALRVGRIGDAQLALPWYVAPAVLMANERLLAEGGLTTETLGKDWDTLREQARAFHAKTGKFLFSAPLGEESRLPEILMSGGIVPFRTGEDGALRADLTRPEIVATAEAWVALFRDGALPRAAGTQGHSHLVQMYQDGQTALLQTGPQMLSRIKDSAPDVFAQTRVLPAVTGSLGRSHVPVMVVGVMSSSREPALAAELAAFVTSGENQLAFAKIVDILPSTLASLEDAHFDRPAEGGDGADVMAVGRALSAEALPEAVAFVPALETWPDLQRAFNEGIKAALLGGADVRDTLAAIEEDWNRILGAALPATMDAVPRPTPVERRAEAAR